MSRYKYSEDDLSRAVAQSSSITEVMRVLGIKLAGGSHFNISKRINKQGLDTSHFTGYAHNKGRPARNRKLPSEILVVRDEGSTREAPSRLKRSLIETGVAYKCEGCGVGSEWNTLPLVLHIDHIDGNWLDNRAENLRFMCPNCHSQTATYCRKK